MKRTLHRAGVGLAAALAVWIAAASGAHAEDRAVDGSAATTGIVTPPDVAPPALKQLKGGPAKTPAKPERGSPSSPPSSASVGDDAPPSPAAAASDPSASGTASSGAPRPPSARPLSARPLSAHPLSAHPPAPPSEQAWRLERASEVVARLHFAGERVQRALRAARSAAPTTSRTTCLDELLSRVHMTARATRDTQSDLAAALARGDLRSADLSLARLTALDARGKRLIAREVTCGASSVHLGAPLGTTVVKVVTPPLPSEADLPRRD